MSDAAAVRAGAGLFRLADRGLLEVRGGDRVRFLQGQLSNDVEALDADGPRSGCYALALTPQGRIVADLHVIARPDCLWLETAAGAVAPARERLEKYVIADDVEIVDRSAEFGWLALEGAAAPAILEAAHGAPVALDPDAARELELGGAQVVVAAWGVSGAPGFRLLAAPEAVETASEALRRAGRERGLLEPDPAVLEVLRVEAGVPATGSELDEEVLPAEARLLERAVSFTKGCYTGQEVVARMESRGRVGHLLVGLALEAGRAPEPGTAVEVDGARVGEVTSAADSPLAGPIALAFVRSVHAEPGTEVALAGRPARVAALPFGAATPGS
ncbi:MAG: glycine cleavage T C-terminal barrel domain-containing protein [Myxococcota bacterium]|nr:glycine cleavage T C-terminal barrel domain-containing protein [Myxococcota bacterium]